MYLCTGTYGLRGMSFLFSCRPGCDLMTTQPTLNIQMDVLLSFCACSVVLKASSKVVFFRSFVRIRVESGLTTPVQLHLFNSCWVLPRRVCGAAQHLWIHLFKLVLPAPFIWIMYARPCIPKQACITCTLIKCWD